MTEATLFRRCRKALGLSLSAMAQALLIANDRTIRRWERGELAISGPAWVALEHLLRAQCEMATADQVGCVVRHRRRGAGSAAPL